MSSINRGTVIRLPFSRSHEVTGDWGVRVGSVDGAKYSLVVICPPDAIVGRYNVSVMITDTADAGKYCIHVHFSLSSSQPCFHSATGVDSGAYCIKLLPKKNSGYFNRSFFPMVKSMVKIMLT